eukprot:TRINITY_DN69519_c0_g1_i1.p4 TRINITY_DN69519_c0_g1~~TRINITY_DN69519_c0_g1_i1.p4  ORF type:complete len:123 (-),score=18.06 TRINITY_DN69519_c0_g1_i1:366-734(-)
MRRLTARMSAACGDAGATTAAAVEVGELADAMDASISTSTRRRPARGDDDLPPAISVSCTTSACGDSGAGACTASVLGAMACGPPAAMADLHDLTIGPNLATNAGLGSGTLHAAWFGCAKRP